MSLKPLPGFFLDLFERFNLIFFALFFMTMGSDFPGQIHLRITIGLFLLIYFLILRAKNGIRWSFPWVVGLFGLFLLFLMIRSGGAWFLLMLGNKPTELRPLVSYSEFPLRWGFCFAFFSISFLISQNFYSAFRRMKWMAWAGFLIAVNAVPMLLMNPKALQGGPWIVRFSHPIFFQPWVSKYFISDFASPNYTGDLISFGFFPALGIAICLYFYMKRKYSMPEFGIKQPLVWLLLYGLFALLSSTAIWLFFSRGTILCFLVSLLFYFLLISLKFSSGAMHRFMISFIAVTILFLVWAGNFHRVVEELGTLGQEVNAERVTSLAHNIEGAKRAIRIIRDYPVWGVGSGNYNRVSELYATPGTEDSMVLANFHAMCYYLQLIAEEGIAAYLLFLFLGGFFFWMLYRLIKTRSHFKFIAALSLAMPCLVVLMHASFNYLMQRFSMSMLVFMTLGAAMGILRHQSKGEERGGLTG